MAIDAKYGRVTIEHGTLGDNEPVVVFRAQDKLLPEVLSVYAHLCEMHGSPRKHVDLVMSTRETVNKWQDANFTKTPSSDNYSPSVYMAPTEDALVEEGDA